MELYQLGRMIGQGNFGQVFLCKHKNEDSENYVVKKLAMFDMNIRDKQNIDNQVKLLQKFRHPNIVSYKDNFTDADGNLYIVMVYCEGGDLAGRIRQMKEKGKNFSEPQILDWLVQIGLAIYYLHNQKIIHRDLKPQNIFLRYDRLRLGDFGIAKMLNSTEDLAKTCTGSPLYMSPDVFKEKISYKSDIWSFGAILYEICNLRPPFEAQNFNALALKILKGSYPPIIQTYSKGLRDLVNQMLSRNPSGRPTIVQILNKPFVKTRVQRYVRDTLTRSDIVNPHDIEYIHLESLKEQCQVLGVQTQFPSDAGASKDGKESTNGSTITETVRRHPSTKDLIGGNNNRAHRVPPISKRGDEENEDNSRPKRKSVHRGQSYSLQRNLKKKDQAASTASTRALNHISEYQKDSSPATIMASPLVDHRQKVLLNKEKKKLEEQKKQLQELKTIAHENEKTRIQAQVRLQKEYRTRVQPSTITPSPSNAQGHKFKVQEDYRLDEDQDISFDDDDDIIHQESDQDLDGTVKANPSNAKLVTKEDEIDEDDDQQGEEDVMGEYNPTYYKLLDKIKVLKHRCETSIGSGKYKKVRKAVANGEDRAHILQLLGEDLVGYWHIVDEIMFMKSMLKIIPKK